MRRESLILLWIIVLCFAGVLDAQPWSGILDPSRAVDWSAVGVTGGIPNRATTCATLDPGATAAQINSAIASCPSGQVVKLNAGTYNISSPIQPISNVTLRGAGMGSTIIQATATFSGDGIISYGDVRDWYLSGQTSFNLVAPQKGDTTISTTSNHNWSPGDYIQIDELEDLTGSQGPIIQLAGGEGSQASQSCRTATTPCRPTGQTVKVISVPAANRAVIDTPLYWTYNQSPQATKISSYHHGMGFEDFTIDNTLAGNAKLLHFSGAFESWVLRVEFIRVQTYGLFMYGAYKSTVRSCTFHEGFAGVGGGYTIMLWNRASANLFEDNIIYNLGIMVLMDGSVTGNVFAYNYGTQPVYGNNSAGTEVGAHGSHPMMNLFEGNQFEGRFRFDSTWGSNSDNTLFRNRVINDTNPAVTAVRNLVDFWAHSQYNNVIGNVLGTVGKETIYQETSGAVHDSALVVYAFGETSLWGDRGIDTRSAATVYRQGNWDSVNSAVRWDEDTVNPNHTMAKSFYTTTKPSYFGNCTWPPIGSDLSPRATDIPAKRRFDSNPCVSAGVPVAPTNLTVVVR